MEVPSRSTSYHHATIPDRGMVTVVAPGASNGEVVETAIPPGDHGRDISVPMSNPQNGGKATPLGSTQGGHDEDTPPSWVVDIYTASFMLVFTHLGDDITLSCADQPLTVRERVLRNSALGIATLLALSAQVVVPTLILVGLQPIMQPTDATTSAEEGPLVADFKICSDGGDETGAVCYPNHDGQAIAAFLWLSVHTACKHWHSA